MSSSSESVPSSQRSSFSLSPEEARRGSNVSTPATSTASLVSRASSPNPTDVLTRQFPKPGEQLDVAEMLARAPARHSLRYYVKNARDVAATVESKEQQAKAFAEVKARLLKAKDDLGQLPSARQ